MSNLKATKRDNTSSGSTNKLRATGLIPAILYGGKNPNQKISIEKKAVREIINSDNFLSKVPDDKSFSNVECLDISSSIVLSGIIFGFLAQMLFFQLLLQLFL